MTGFLRIRNYFLSVCCHLLLPSCPGCKLWHSIPPLRPEQENVRMEAIFEKAILKIVSFSFKMIAITMCSLIHWAQNWNNEIVRLVVHPKDAWATTLAAHNVITCIDGLCSNSILYTGFDQYILVSFLITLSPSEKCSVSVEMAFSFRGKNLSLLSRKCEVDCVAYGAREVVTPWYRLSKYQNCFSGVLFFSR